MFGFPMIYKEEEEAQLPLSTARRVFHLPSVGDENGLYDSENATHVGCWCVLNPQA